MLILVRLYFAFSPSYIHPDENFQGPEVIAGMSNRFLGVLFQAQGQLIPSIMVCGLQAHVVKTAMHGAHARCGPIFGLSETFRVQDTVVC